MANLIAANEIPGASVYGVAQVNYTVDGEAGNDYAAALTAAAFREATAIERAASSYMVVVRQRQVKVSELGDVLATLATAVGSLKADKHNGASPDDPSATSWQMDVAFRNARNTCAKYNLSLNVREKRDSDGWLRYYMTRGDLMTSQNDIQYELDVEDNNLQQDMVSLQGFVSKRDAAFSTASKIVSKSHNAADSTIGNIG